MLQWVLLALAIVALVCWIGMAAYMAIWQPRVIHRYMEEHPALPLLRPVDLASTEHIDIKATPWPAVDGVPPKPGSRVVLQHQSPAIQNGVWQLPLDYDQPWERVDDEHLQEGALILVLHGNKYADVTLVVRRQNRHHGQGPVHFDSLLPFVLSGGGRSTDRTPCDQHVLTLDDQGFSRWLRPEEVAGQVMDTLHEHRLQHVSKCDIVSSIPAVLHFVWGMWDEDQHLPDWAQGNIDRWKAQNPKYHIKVWNRQRAHEFVRANCSPHWLDLFERLGPGVRRTNLFRCLLLYHEGGIYLDLDSYPESDWNWETLLQAWQYPRLVLFEESVISEFEAEMINKYAIRSTCPLLPGQTRLAMHVLASAKRHPFWHFMLAHMRRWTMEDQGQEAYEVVFATGTDGLSYVFSTYGADFVDHKCLPVGELTRLVHHDQRGSWKPVNRLCITADVTSSITTPTPSGADSAE